MTGTPVDLLSMLASGLKSIGSAIGGQPQNLSRTDVESARFAELLDRAQSGEFSSDLKIKVDRSVDLKLTDDQLERLATIADEGEAAGSKSVLVLIDGMALKLDVAERTIVDEVDLNQGSVFGGVDAVARAPKEDGSAHGGVGTAVLPLPSGLTTGNPTLLHALAEAERLIGGRGASSQGLGDLAESGKLISGLFRQS